MQVRPFTEQDRSLYYQLSQAFYQTNAVLHPTDPQLLAHNFDTVIQGTPYLQGFLLEQSGRPAGFALVVRSYSTELAKPLVWLEELYIDPTFQGQGLGSAFLHWMLEQYPGSAFRLEVTAENTGAKKLYERCGYHTLDYIQMVKK